MIGGGKTGTVLDENIDFIFVDPKNPARIDIFDKDSKAEILHVMVRGVDDESLYFSTLKNKLCYGHFVFRLRLTQRMKNRLRLSMTMANITPKEFIIAAQHQPIPPYYGCILDCIAILGEENVNNIPETQRKQYIEKNCPYIIGKQKAIPRESEEPMGEEFTGI